MITNTMQSRLISLCRALLLGLPFFCGHAQAAVTSGPYDGIYQWSPGNYLSLHQDGTHMIATIYFNADGNFSFPATSGAGELPVPQLDIFDLMNGLVIGSTVRMNGTRFHRACNVSYDFTFNNNDTITVFRAGVSNSAIADAAGISCSAIVGMEAATIGVPKIRFNPNTTPVANAGSAQTVVAGTMVTLNGSASSDANGDTLTYLWALIAKPAGSTANLNSVTAVNPTFTADIAGTYVSSLTVNDGQLNSATATVSVTATATQAPAYEQEFNDDYAHANLFFLGQKMFGSLSNSSDVDWFAIDINNYNGFSTVNFEITNSNPGFGFWNVYFFDPDMQALAGFNVNPAVGFLGKRENIPTFKVGRYYIRVRTNDPSSYNGSGYSVTVTSPP